jgi:hypothetical protein
VAGLALGLLAACASIPTTGEIESWPRPAATQNAGNIAITAQGPAQGAKPNMIIDGFLTAMAQYEPGYTTARQFLTTAAAERWRPGSSVLLYSDLAGLTLSADGTSASIPSPQLIGHLDPDGVYWPAEGGVSPPLEFALEQDGDGQWRISDLPDDMGIIVSRASFNNAYQRVDMLYLDDSGRVLIPDSRYLPRGNWLRQLVESLLAGPSWRVADVVAADPVGRVGLDPEREPVLDGGVVDIPLSESIGRLLPAEATRLALQCAATLLQQVPNLAAVRLSLNGLTLALEGATLNGGLPVTEVARFDANLRPSADPPLLTAGIESVIRLGASRVEGGLDTVAGAVTALALSSNAQTAAAVAAGELILAGPNTPGTLTVLSQAGLVRPQFDRDGRLWAMAPADPDQAGDPGQAGGPTAPPGGEPTDGTGAGDALGALVWAVAGERATLVAAPALADKTVRAFRLAPDGRRVAVVADVLVAGQTQRRLGLVDIRHLDDASLSLDVWRDIPVVVDNASLTGLTDVVWIGPSTLAVIGTSASSDTNAVYQVRLDGVEPVEEIGRPGARSLVALEAAPASGAVVVLDENGQVYRWLDRHEWQILDSGVRAMAYPV